MAKSEIVPMEIGQENLRSLIYTIRGRQVMLDADLAAIYGYSTGQFNLQVKHNIDRFDEEDLMFQLTNQEFANLILKFSTSRWGGTRKCPYAFTEQGIYMLMTVLKGPLAVKQSKTLVRLFKQMKDYIVENQPLLGQREFLQLSLQTSENIHEIIELKGSLAQLDDKVAKMADRMGDVVTHSELSEIMLDFGNPVVRRGWLILNGQPVESDLAYKQIYALAHRSIYMIDNYIGLKTLSLVSDVDVNVEVTVITDNTQGKLHKAEYDDFVKEFPSVKLKLLQAGGIFHDRYIVLDYNTPDEKIYHCGASSKDGGNKVMTIILVEDTVMYHPVIDSVLGNPELVLK